MTSSASRNTEPSTTNPKGPDMCGLYPIPTEPGNVKVTPDMAKHWLEHHRTPSRQRRYSKYLAQKWASTMTAGRWKERSPEGISFDWDGFNIDGQHRLGAIALTGLTIEMFVHPNCDPDVFDALNQGRKRQIGDLLHCPHANVVAAATRVIAVVTATGPRGQGVQGGVYDGSLSVVEGLEIAEQWPELADFAAAVHNVYRVSKISAPIHLAIAAQASRSRYADRLTSWFDGLASGAGLDANDPRLHLRNRFIKDSRALAVARGQSYNLIAKAWNAHALQRPMGVLKAAESEGVIRVIG